MVHGEAPETAIGIEGAPFDELRSLFGLREAAEFRPELSHPFVEFFIGQKAGVPWSADFHARSPQRALKLERGRSEFAGETDIQQVKAVSQLNDGSKDCGMLDLAAFAAALCLSPLEGAGGSVLPKVDAVAEPVVEVDA